LRALQVCGVRRYQHIQRGCSSEVAKYVLSAADTLVLCTFYEIIELNEIDEACLVLDKAMRRVRLNTRYGGMQLPCMADELDICNYSGYAAAIHDAWLRYKQFSENIPAKNAVHLMETMPESLEWAKNAKDSYQRLSRFNNLSNSDIDGLKQISPPKRHDFKAGTMVGWRDSHISRAGAPEIINIPTVESLCKN